MKSLLKVFSIAFFILFINSAFAANLTIKDFTLEAKAPKDDEDHYIPQGAIIYLLDGAKQTCSFSNERLFLAIGQVTVCEDEPYNAVLRIMGDKDATYLEVSIYKTVR